MSRPTLRRALLIALVAGLVVLPARAFAASPEIFHGTFSDAFDDVDVCGVIVDIHSEGVFTDQVTFDKAGVISSASKSTVSVKTTFTAANGKQVIVEQAANQFTDVAPIIDEAAGTITFVTTFKGLPEKIKTPHGGRVLLRDAGVISFVDTFDLNTGDLHLWSNTIVKGPASGSRQRLPALLRGRQKRTGLTTERRGRAAAPARGAGPLCPPQARGAGRRRRAEHGSQRERRPPGRRRHRRGEETGATTPTAESAVCWKPIAAPLLRPPISAAIVKEAPFQAIERAVATTSAGTSAQPGATGEPRRPRAPRRRRPRRAQRADPLPEQVQPAADPDPQRRRAPGRPRARRPRRRRRSRARRGGRGR